MFKTVSALIVAGGFVFGATPAFNITILPGGMVGSNGTYITTMVGPVIYLGALPI